MLRIRLIALGLFAFLAVGSYSLDKMSVRGVSDLEGAWIITSVEREGVADSTPVGSLVTFAGDVATFEPKSIWAGAGVLVGEEPPKFKIVENTASVALR